ncbi:hypothetical protein TEA_000633 [Camellia sinensis var. sinensis]|uniref:Plastocyanin-like domain-containing protein n=1 Tax=Camellia sinensis var. sinensis TaxID=542762 RepID=A0A4S4ET83_CAMSN|nr:hypothetical protein TEA_000633 [Camellia sinensis var. sinensis]
MVDGGDGNGERLADGRKSGCDATMAEGRESGCDATMADGRIADLAFFLSLISTSKENKLLGSLESGAYTENDPFLDTSILGAESHPLHLHGFNFFVVGQGFGNYDPNEDPKSFNLVDPIERNTVGVPSGGWIAIRFLADNPGVWFMHCHLEVHTSWGLKMAWLVLDGKLPNQKLLPPPSDLPKC